MKYKMTLSSEGNPDFNQNAPVSEALIVEADTIKELQDAARVYIDKWDLGCGNWVTPDVVEIATCETIGTISYNGMFWHEGSRT